MVGTAEVRIWGETAGAVHWDNDRGFASFEFFPDFARNNWDLSPIHMPVHDSTGRIYAFPSLPEVSFKGLPGLLSDSLPDEFGHKMIDQWLAVMNINGSAFTPVDRLCYIGERGMGALEFHPAMKYARDKKSTPLEIDQLVEFAGKVLDERKRFNAHLKDEKGLMELIRVGSSAGGQRPKAIIAFNEHTREVRSGQVTAPPGFEHWILKLDGVTHQTLKDPKGFGRIEYACYRMALACGIVMNESRLLEEGGRAHFMTKRFDRQGSEEKIHMQTLCALAHYDYQSQGYYAYENAFEVMRQMKLPAPQFEQLYRRMVFNILVRNQDDHTKNIAFLMNKTGIWNLSPAYDVTYAYNPDGFWTNRHQMSVNGKRDDFTKKDLLSVGDKISLKKSVEIPEEISEIISHWHTFAEEAGIPLHQANRLFKAFRLTLA